MDNHRSRFEYDKMLEMVDIANYASIGAQNMCTRLHELHSLLFSLVDEEHAQNASTLFEPVFLALFANLQAILEGTDKLKGSAFSARKSSKGNTLYPLKSITAFDKSQ